MPEQGVGAMADLRIPWELAAVIFQIAEGFKMKPLSHTCIKKKTLHKW